MTSALALSCAMKIGIVGLGYVGLPLAVAFAEAGCDVVGVDVDAGKIAALREGRSHIEDIPDERLPARAGALHVHDALRRAARGRRDPRLRPDAADAQPRAGPRAAARRRAVAGRRDPARARRSSSSRRRSPARRASTSCRCWRSPACARARTSRWRSRPSASTRAAPTTRCARRRRSSAGSRRPAPRRAVAVYAPSATTSCRSPRPRSPSSRSCSRTSSARSTSRWSTRWRCSPTAWGSTSGRSSTRPRPSRTASCASSPGPGMGGHCLPVDPFYLTWKAREYDISTEFIELAGKVNQQMPYFCLEKAERALNDAGKPVRGSRDPGARRLLQGRRGRHPRVAGAEDHPAAARARRATSPTTTRTCPSSPTSGCAASSCRPAPTASTSR